MWQIYHLQLQGAASGAPVGWSGRSAIAAVCIKSWRAALYSNIMEPKYDKNKSDRLLPKVVRMDRELPGRPYCR